MQLMMFLTAPLILLLSVTVLDARYSLYHSNNHHESDSTFDCLYAYLEDSFTEQDTYRITNYNLIPYCRRLTSNVSKGEFSLETNENIDTEITFSELYRKGVTSEDLLNWFAPIDMAEEYEIKGQNSNQTFLNCSLPWFGSQCQYRTLDPVPLSFSALVQSIFRRRITPPFQHTYLVDVPCYPFLPNCYRSASYVCLDWREICDGTVDCIDGEDEQFCSALELSECSEGEYRCHFGGQCIPSDYVRDGQTSSDCLDGSDEIYVNDKLLTSRFVCVNHPTFRCEEYKTRRLRHFSCGDGEYYHRAIPHFGYTCNNYRGESITSKMFASLDYIADAHCRQIFYGLFRPSQTNSDIQIGNNSFYQTLTNHCHWPWFVWPEYPILFKFFQFVYFNNRSVGHRPIDRTPDLICVNASHCPVLSFCAEDREINDGLHCCRTSRLVNQTINDWNYELYALFDDLTLRCATIGTDKKCSDSSLFHCPQSLKCISKHRLVDGERDCYYGEDESFATCELNDPWRFPCTSEPNKCLSLIAVENKQNDCRDGEDEYGAETRDHLAAKLPFAMFCDGTVDIHQRSNASNVTDETNCYWWPCSNPYTRCDQQWHCLNGLDELNCPSINCPFNEHKCISPNGATYSCISLSDLKEQYSQWTPSPSYYRKVYRLNHIDETNLTGYFAWKDTQCITAKHLLPHAPLSITAQDDVCLIQSELPLAHRITTAVMSTVYPMSAGCALVSLRYDRNPIRFLQTSRFGNRPVVSINAPLGQAPHVFSTPARTHRSIFVDDWYCHRGMAFLHGSNRTKICLCPPSYFGDRCQWQSERISFTFQLIYRQSTYSVTAFQVLVLLIDEQRQSPSSYEQLTYVPTQDCGAKFNVYLLYPHRPKNLSTNYFLHVDVYDKITLTYWASWQLPISFPFLPVNRVAAQLSIPSLPQAESCSLPCGNHGRCRRYINKNCTYFCQCDRGYSGLRCETASRCSCSSDALCRTSSICVCSLNKFGAKCYLTHPVDRTVNQSCQNRALHVPVDDRFGMRKFRCVCQENFHGERCESIRNRIDIDFAEEVIGEVTMIYLHYITTFERNKHQRTTALKKIRYNENSLSVFVTHPFHILIAESLKKSYYLVVTREKFIRSEHIRTSVTSNERCLSTDELFNATFRSYSHLHRIKYYPLLCRQNRELTCLYDESYMCICDQDRFSNCFTFDHGISYDCQGQNDCENSGQCFQDNPTCPSLTLCVCPECYYGPQCRLSTKGFVLSLDYILGYHIKPHVPLDRQPLIVKVSLALTIVIFTSGAISAILSILTFHAKKIRDIGCGLYLLTSFYVSILIVSALIIKSCQLIFSQMGILTSRPWLSINCRLMDMITQILLVSNDWLHGSVTVERVLMVIKKVKFDKSRSKQLAKWISSGIILCSSLTHLHYPFYRHLTDVVDVDERRTWCLVEYSSSVNTFNSFIALFHFLVPFSINITCILLTIVFLARSHVSVQPRFTLKAHVRRQFKEHKHHLITSCTLVLLALPRLIISFINGCMKSPRNSGLFLAAYLISFLPSMTAFLMFVLPSNLYKKEFDNVMARTIRRVRGRVSN